MPQIKPFQALRYSKDIITDFICPPYDVISPEEKKKLQKNSPFNIVHIELSDPSGSKNKYRHAAEIFKAWQKEGILTREENPSLYFYEQVFDDHGIKMIRRGFFCALKLENPHSGKGAVKPHEKTLAKPKADRLSLLKAVKANISPIFGLFDDDKLFVVNIAKKIATKRVPNATAVDKQGVFHRLWAVSDEDIIKDIEKFLTNKKMFIADGHHRYETAWNYSQERKEKDSQYSSDKDYNFVLTFLCPIEDPGISIWPTHRVIKEPLDLEENIEKYFNVHPAKDFLKLSKKDIQPLMIFKDKKYRVLTIKNENLLKKAMPDKSKAYRNLAVSILHYILIPKIDASEFTYVKDDKEATILATKEKKIAIIVPSTPAKSLKAICLNNEMMPQKSTYFYPKLASGIVIKAL
ncbi:MAG: DUF1015 domain-containing protein [Elusimicrobiota bacterium]|jgi:uncharacterized protein (DUF1015 family)|nr:DUF1015 domain-containing protein [Elusimicrobiota bacterium]